MRDVKNLSVTPKQETDCTLTPPSVSPSASPSACPQNLSYPDTEANINDAKLVINNYNHDTNVMSFTILNTTQSIMTLPTFYTLEKYENEKWVPASRKTDNVKAMAAIIFPGDKLVNETDLDNDYENLSDGNYRIGVSTSFGKVYAEFIIATTTLDK